MGKVRKDDNGSEGSGDASDSVATGDSQDDAAPKGKKNVKKTRYVSMKLKKHNPKMGLAVPLKVIAAKGMSSGKTTVKCARRSCGSKELPFPTSFNSKGKKSSSQRHANVVGIHFARIGWIGLHNHSTT